MTVYSYCSEIFTIIIFGHTLLRVFQFKLACLYSKVVPSPTTGRRCSKFTTGQVTTLALDPAGTMTSVNNGLHTEG